MPKTRKIMQKKSKNQSIRARILKAVLYPLALLAITLGISSILLVNRLANEDAVHLITQVCEKETLRLDNRLHLVQHSVSILYEYINEINQDSKYKLYSDEYSERIREYAISISNQTDGAMAVYYRYNPELTGTGTGGFFWSRLSNDVQFTEQPPTDILRYNSSDIEHVGWFYVPRDTKEPLWMKPYYNQNLGVFMISYIIPIYSDKHEFLGVVGMDIDFNSIMRSESDITLYETGKIALVDLSEHLIYTSGDDRGSYSEKLSNKLYNHITTINKANKILEILEDDGSKSVICCRRLTNGMTLYVNVPQDEIYANRNRLMFFIVMLTSIICGITVYDIRRHTSRITEPINRLAEITGYYAKGDWSHNYICHTGDELQKLSESIETMAGNTQDYLSTLNDLARTDSLTGLKNKTSYLEYVRDIKMHRHDNHEYGLVVMDLNLLKRANDTYGHEAGDILLVEASRYIYRSFAHSAAFRIGGDEFVVILTGDAYRNRFALCDAFERGMNYEVRGVSDIRLSISYGLASCPDDTTDYEELFRLADDRMYAKKKEMKLGRGDERAKL